MAFSVPTETTDLYPIQRLQVRQTDAQSLTLGKLVDHCWGNDHATSQDMKDIQKPELMKVLNRRGIGDEIRQGVFPCAVAPRSDGKCPRRNPLI